MTDQGHLRLDANIWIYFAIAIALTLLTLALWSVYMWLSKRQQSREMLNRGTHDYYEMGVRHVCE